MSSNISDNTTTESVNERIPLNHRIILHNRPVSESTGDIEINVWEWPGKYPTILFCHAVSFHGRCFDEIISSFPDQHIITFDFRGHGYSSQTPPYTLPVYSEDLSELIQKLNIEEAIGVGHSLGGYALARASILNPNAFLSVILLEPIFFPKSMLVSTAPKEAQLLLKKILQRRNTWSSSEEMFDYYKNNPSSRKWSSTMLQNYCKYNLLSKQNEDGYIQACSNQTEYSICLNVANYDVDIYDRLAEIKIPVHIVRSGYPCKHGKFDTSHTPADLVTYFPNAHDIELENVSHFIPMEVPTFVSNLIKDTLTNIENSEEYLME